MQPPKPRGCCNVNWNPPIDATRHRPPKHKLDAAQIAGAIRGASIGDQIRFEVGDPATDSARSLDFDRVGVAGALLPTSDIQVEVSYRGAVIDEPLPCLIGEPFYGPFEILAMQPHEIAAEKLRTLAQRARPTDLADLVVVLARNDVRDDDIARVAAEKFTLVAKGRANRVARIESNLLTIGADYDATIPLVFPGGATYAAAFEAVWPRIRSLIPS